MNEHNWQNLSEEFLYSQPFNHVVIDNFFEETEALNIYNSMPDYDGVDIKYHNLIEIKGAEQSWYKFTPQVYSALHKLCNRSFVDNLRIITNQPELDADYGLHGAGIHILKKDSYLNVHQDYIIHPKLLMKRKLNLIVYMTPNWEESWGGCLELWSNDRTTNQPDKCIKKIVPMFNRAVIFDTTQNSWHGVPGPISPPDGVYRKSLAMYYLIPTDDVGGRKKAMFSPRENQKDNKEVLDFIKKRMES